MFNNTSLAGQIVFSGVSVTEILRRISILFILIRIPVHIRLRWLQRTRAPVILWIQRPGTIHVFPKPAADFTTRPVPAQYNTPTIFSNASTGATTTLCLVFRRRRFNHKKNSADTVIHQYEQTNTFNAVWLPLISLDVLIPSVIRWKA